MIPTSASASRSMTRARFSGRDVTEAECVTDDDAALHAERLAALGDHLQLEQAEFAALVQMDVDFGVLAMRDVENGIEMTARITIDIGRIYAADDTGAFIERRFHQLCCARLD